MPLREHRQERLESPIDCNHYPFEQVRIQIYELKVVIRIL